MRRGGGAAVAVALIALAACSKRNEPLGVSPGTSTSDDDAGEGAQDGGAAAADAGAVYSCLIDVDWCDELTGRIPAQSECLLLVEHCPPAPIAGCRLAPDHVRWYYPPPHIFVDGGPPGGIYLGFGPPDSCDPVDLPQPDGGAGGE